jgi:hypothetical protein
MQRQATTLDGPQEQMEQMCVHHLTPNQQGCMLALLVRLAHCMRWNGRPGSAFSAGKAVPCWDDEEGLGAGQCVSYLHMPCDKAIMGRGCPVLYRARSRKQHLQ